MKKIKIFLLLLIVFSSSCSGSDSNPDPNPNPTPEIIEADASIIKVNDHKQLIRGFGAATVFDPPGVSELNNSDYDKLFGTGNDNIGLSILRIRVATDANYRAKELNRAIGAKARGAIIIACPWSPPASMKTNNNLTGGSLKTESYEDYANYLNDFANYMATNNAELYAIGIQNEPDIQVSYESCDWTAFQIRDFLKDNGHLITSAKVISPESFNFNHATTDAMLNDATAASNVDIVGGHIYGSGLEDYPLARSKGKEVWMTEHYTDSQNSGNDWPLALDVGKEIHDCMTIGNFNAYVWWYAKRYYGPLDEDGTITKRGYLMSNYAKFVRPGYVRVDATANPKTNVYASAYTGNGKTVIVAVNTGTSNVVQQFAIEGTSVTSVTPYVTSETDNIAAKTSVNLNSDIDAFKFTLPAKSVVTFVSN
ncbi:MAG TPA: glucuronoxylanase [Flavobacteriaceae bacterium]|nr:glucuronoxylanase [Flavobacteriaceae bacterium]